ncbi:transposase [Candidatus Desantisbacteria bacterium]|nr:transposase [Candidatus Desantisbacteria bacterium]
MNKYKKRIRLKNFDYIGIYRYFITLCTHDNSPIFNNNILITKLTNILKIESEKFRFKIWIYCFMPDHVHLLIEGKDLESDMKKLISTYKQYTGFYYKKDTGKCLWQVNYYEHVLRKEEDTLSVAKYILNNPVRKGLVEDYKQYDYIGSFELDIMQL